MRSTLAATVFVATLIVAGVFGIGFWTCHQPPKPNSETAQIEKGAKKYCSTFYGTIIAGFRDSGAFITANHNEINAASAVAVALFTAVLSVFTISLSGSTRAAAEAAKKAANAAKLSADAAIGVEIPRLFIYDLEFVGEGAADYATSLQSPKVLVRIKNYGRTPAFLGSQSVEMAVVTTLPAEPRYINARELDPGTVIECSEPYDLPTACLPILLHPELIAALRSERCFVWVFGFIAYRDFLNKPHEMRFCCRYRMASNVPGFPARFIFDGPPEYTKSY